MVHRFVPRCQIGPGSNPASVVCGWWFCLWVCRAVGPGPLLLAVPGPAVWCVLGGVLLSRTLAGAVPSALSGLASGFGMECRAFPCRCDHRDDCTGSAWAVLIVVTVIRLSGCLGCPLTTRCVCVLVCGWVGCGPYSGRLALTAGVHPCLHSLTSCVGVEVLLFVLAY